MLTFKTTTLALALPLGFAVQSAGTDADLTIGAVPAASHQELLNRPNDCIHPDLAFGIGDEVCAMQPGANLSPSSIDAHN